jgi:hypothetical protein
MPRNENHQVGLYETTLPTRDYDTLLDAAKAELQAVERQLATDPDAKSDFRVRTALEVRQESLKKALGVSE